MHRARARWNSAGLGNYSLEQRKLCFCPPGEGDWARVMVRDGRIVSAMRVDDGASIATGGRLTVPQLFEILEQSRHDEFASDIKVAFHATYGYPTLIEVVAKPDVTDGGLIIQARALVAEP
ncbi:MAG: DUF6174 domain-containing protein [Gemmatimonadaceae bacterium]